MTSKLTEGAKGVYIIAATPPNAKPWGIYEAGCKNGLVLHGKAGCAVSVAVDRGKNWQSQTMTPSTTGASFIDWNITAQMVRFRFRENNALGAFRWRSYEYEWQPAGDFSGSF